MSDVNTEINDFINYRVDFSAEIVLIEGVNDYTIKNDEGKEINIKIDNNVFIRFNDNILKYRLNSNILEYKKDIDWYSD